MDMATFYKQNPLLCVSDVTNGKKVQIEITEYDRDICKDIRKNSGIDYTGFLRLVLISSLWISYSSFAPKENHIQMTTFQIGSGKSDSFFFYTANSQFIIKTLKEAELKLLVRKGILDKYHKHL